MLRGDRAIALEENAQNALHSLQGFLSHVLRKERTTGHNPLWEQVSSSTTWRRKKQKPHGRWKWDLQTTLLTHTAPSPRSPALKLPAGKQAMFFPLKINLKCSPLFTHTHTTPRAVLWTTCDIVRYFPVHYFIAGGRCLLHWFTDILTDWTPVTHCEQPLSDWKPPSPVSNVF